MSAQRHPSVSREVRSSGLDGEPFSKEGDYCASGEEFSRTEAAPHLPTGQVLPIQTILKQRADHERIAVSLRKLRDKCPGVSDNSMREIETRFMQTLYMQSLTPPQWYKGALAISEQVLGGHYKKFARKIHQILFVSSRFQFSEEPEPEILRHYEVGEKIPDTIAHSPLTPEEHTMKDIGDYLHNRLGATILKVISDPSIPIEIFIGPREDMVAYYRSKDPPLSLTGEMESPKSTEFYLFEHDTGSPTVVLRGISNPTRFHHQLWQLRYAGIDCARIKIHGTFRTSLAPQIGALHRELARLPVKPTIAVIGQRWWSMEILGTLAGIIGKEGEAYDGLQPTQFRIGTFTFDYVVANVAGAPANRNKIGIAAFRMPNGSLAGDAMQALLDNGTTHVLFCGAGGSLDAHTRVGSYQICTEAVAGDDVYSLPRQSLFLPHLPDDYPITEIGRNITVDSPLQETEAWLKRSKAISCTAVDVESAHLMRVLAGAAASNSDIRVTPGLFISDIVGGEESLTEKIGGGDAYAQLLPLLRSYFSRIGIGGVYDAGGNLHSFAEGQSSINPSLVAAAQAVPDTTRQAILGVRLGGEDFPLLSAPKRRVEYPDLQSMGGHKHILYVVPAARTDEVEWSSFLERSTPEKLFLAFPASTSSGTVEKARHFGYETIVIVAPDEMSFPQTDYIVSRDAGWGTYETIVATHTHSLAIFGNPEGYGELMLAMENRERSIFVSTSFQKSTVLDELEDFETFTGAELAEKLETRLNLHKLERWVARIRPDIEIIPLSSVRRYAGPRKIIGVSGSSKTTQFDPESTERAFRELLNRLDSERIMFATGGTDYGVEQILHRLVRKGFPAFRIIGFITCEGRGDELGTSAVTVAGVDWFGKSVPFLNAIDFLMTVAGGGVIHQELLMAHKAGIPLFPLAGSGMKTDEFLKDNPDVQRYHTGMDIAAAIEEDE